MALNPLYMVSINLQEYVVDKNTGLPLSGGYIECWQDTSRTTPKLVYQLTGSPPNYTYSPLPNPIQLSAIGVPVNANDDQVHIYYYPYDEDGNLQLYYITVYSEEDVLQYTLEAWPNITEVTSPTDTNNSTANQLSNPQFVTVNFISEEGLTIEFDDAVSEQSYLIAPDWELIVTSIGSGSIIVQQEALAGSLNIPTNPPNKVTFQPEGNNITSLILRQRLPNNPSIWSTTTDSEGYLSGIMLIQSLDGQAQTISMQYTQSAGASSPQIIVSGSTLTTGYQLLNDTVLLNAGTNTDSGESAEVFIDIVLPTNGYYALTSLQVVGLNDDEVEVSFEQETTNRQIDHLFHYYKSQLDFKPIKSYLCGWDFPLNPAQAYGSSVSSWGAASKYVWDQTIIWQSLNSSISVTRATTGNIKGSLNIAVGSTCQFAVIQYLTVPEIIDLLSNPLSSNIVLSTNQSSLKGTISLWATEDLTAPNINTESKSLVTSLTDDGKPSGFNGTWFEIPRSNYGDAIFTTKFSEDLNELESFGFNGWNFNQNENGKEISTITYFAIVIGFSEVESSNNVVIQSCSLVPGSIPTIPAPQTFNEVLDDCQYYYEMSYEIGTLPGTATAEGVLTIAAAGSYDGTNFDVYAQYVNIYYKKPKVTEPVFSESDYSSFVFYSYLTADATNSFVLKANWGAGPIAQNFNTAFDLDEVSKNNISFDPVSGGTTYPQHSGSTPYATGQFFHYTIDTRIGVY
jgi:hypothetical protein